MTRAVESQGKHRSERLESLASGLKSALGDELLSVVLYGSAARGDWTEGGSDLNVVVVVRELELALIEKSSSINRSWVAEGNRPLLFFSPWWIRHSCDVFPLEFLDILESHRVIHGQDPFADLEVPQENLRLQCESEIKTRLIQLRTGYLEFHDDPAALSRLLAGSYSALAALSRGVLRLAGEAPPAKASEAVARVAALCGLEEGPLSEVESLKRSGGKGASSAPRRLFQNYYRQVETLARAIDAGQIGGSRK